VDFYYTYLSLFTLVTFYLNDSFVHSRKRRRGSSHITCSTFAIQPQLQHLFSNCILHFATIWKSHIKSFSISVSLGGPGKHYINCVLLPLDFYVDCDFVRHQLNAYYHLLQFQSFSHSLGIYHSDGLQFASFESTLGLCYWREEPRHLDQLLHTCCNFVLFALSSRVTNSTSLYSCLS